MKDKGNPSMEGGHQERLFQLYLHNQRTFDLFRIVNPVKKEEKLTNHVLEHIYKERDRDREMYTSMHVKKPLGL